MGVIRVTVTHIHLPKSADVDLELDGAGTVRDLKRALQRRTHTAGRPFPRLVFCENVLHDGTPLSAYNIRDACTVIALPSPTVYLCVMLSSFPKFRFVTEALPEESVGDATARIVDELRVTAKPGATPTLVLDRTNQPLFPTTPVVSAFEGRSTETEGGKPCFVVRLAGVRVN